VLALVEQAAAASLALMEQVAAAELPRVLPTLRALRPSQGVVLLRRALQQQAARQGQAVLLRLLLLLLRLLAWLLVPAVPCQLVRHHGPHRLPRQIDCLQRWQRQRMPPGRRLSSPRTPSFSRWQHKPKTK